MGFPIAMITWGEHWQRGPGKASFRAKQYVRRARQVSEPKRLFATTHQAPISNLGAISFFALRLKSRCGFAAKRCSALSNQVFQAVRC
jgi:hypothetical protein